jgi:hypothetical protein
MPTSWITARPTFGLLQGSLEQYWQNGLSNKVDGVTGQQRCPRRLVQVCAEKDAAQCLACMKLSSCVDTAAAPRETNVHQNHIRTKCVGTGNGIGRRRYSCTDLVTQFHHKHRKMHGDDNLVFDDKNTHRSSCGRKRY